MGVDVRGCGSVLVWLPASGLSFPPPTSPGGPLLLCYFIHLMWMLLLGLSTVGLQIDGKDPVQLGLSMRKGIPADKEGAWRKALQVCPSHFLPPHHSLWTA